MYFHKEIFKTADVIVSPMTGYCISRNVSAFSQLACSNFIIHSDPFPAPRACSVTAYTLQDDALETGELDYINGGTNSLILNNS